MKHLFPILLAFMSFIDLNAQLPERTSENVTKYKKICRQHIYKDM